MQLNKMRDFKWPLVVLMGLVASLNVDLVSSEDIAGTTQSNVFVEQSGNSDNDFGHYDIENVESTNFKQINRTEENNANNESVEKYSQRETNIRGSQFVTAGSRDIENVDAAKVKRRRHQLRRKAQVGCNIQCFSDANCIANANSFTGCGNFRTCNVNGFCQDGNRGGTRCNWNCQNNFSICNGASDGCSFCNGFQCVRGANRQRCGQFCSNNPWICNDATDGCTECNGSTCSGNRAGLKCGWNCQNNFSICNNAADGCSRCDGFRCVNSGGGLTRCGTPCLNNPNICNGATDGCTICSGSTGTCTSGGRLTCGSSCFGVNSCLNALNGCTQCINGFCEGNRSGGVCVSTELELRARLEGGGTINICPNASIVVNSEIITSRSNIFLQCQGGGTGCTIRGPTGGQHRLITFSGQSIEIRGITFQNGFTTGSGGAIRIEGNNNRIFNCSFIGNRARQQGGAAYVGSTTFAGNTFTGNSAAQCINVFQSQTRQCFG